MHLQRFIGMVPHRDPPSLTSAVFRNYALLFAGNSYCAHTYMCVQVWVHIHIRMHWKITAFSTCWSEKCLRWCLWLDSKELHLAAQATQWASLPLNLWLQQGNGNNLKVYPTNYRSTWQCISTANWLEQVSKRELLHWISYRLDSCHCWLQRKLPA